jgi:multidrug efflux pump subunit AcrB
MNIEPIFDQSVFVRAAVKGVEHEILLVGGLVATVVLVFLGSWRSTLIVLTSIPVALLCSIARGGRHPARDSQHRSEK